MFETKTINCHQIDDYVAEMMGEGYYFCVSILRECDDGSAEKESTEWFIHPNGTFSGSTYLSYPFEPPQEVVRFEGTFEQSKYNDYVKQIQESREEWRNELEYTLYDDGDYDYDVERRIMSREPFDLSQVDLSELLI